MFKNKTKQPSCRTNFSHIFIYTQPKTKATYIVHKSSVYQEETLSSKIATQKLDAQKHHK